MTTPPPTLRLTAQTTPFRRSVFDLMDQLSELFDSYAASSSPHQDALEPHERTAPISALPALIDAFEARRNIQLLTEDEKQQLAHFAAGAGANRVGVDDFVGIIQAMGSTSSQAAPPAPAPSSDLDAPSAVTPSMLAPDTAPNIADGSPAPRRRTTSAQSTSNLALSTPPPASPSKLSKRRSLLSALSYSPGSPTGAQPDLADIVVARGGTYLGVQLDGPLGAGFNAEAEADKLRVATKGLGTREKGIIAVLADKTFPQIRAIDRAYHDKFDKSLLQLISSEKSLRGNIEYALKGLVMGPVNFDVYLIGKALDGTMRNETLLIDLLIGRPPSALAILRAAYRRRPIGSSASPIKPKSLEATVLSAYSTNAKLKKAWEVALQGKWEDQGDAGEGEGGGAGGRTEEQRAKLLREDVDQLKVALRKGGNSDLVTKILLARSPAHIYLITVEFRKHSPTTLTRAIKQVFNGTLEKLLLFAVENGKNFKDGPGVWRDAKMLEKTMEGAGTRNEALTWRLIRLHWDRPRFLLVQGAFKQKYKKVLLDRVAGETSSAFRDLLRVVIGTANLAEPTRTPEDTTRLEALMAPRSRSRASSVSSVASSVTDGEADDAGSVKSEGKQPSLLEGEGELPNPPSPRSPAAIPYNDQDGTTQEITPQPPSVAQFGNTADVASPPHTPTLPSSDSTSNLASSTSSTDGGFVKGHKTSSSLSFRQRSSPLEPLGHRPGSSTGGSLDKSHSSLRHSRPVAPGRRRQSHDQSGGRGGSEEPISPSHSRSNSPLLTRSPTPNEMGDRPRKVSGPTSSFSAPGDGSSSPPSGRSLSNSTSSLDSFSSSRPGSRQAGNVNSLSSPDTNPSSLAGPTSPLSALDTTSYHDTPISPSGDLNTPPPSSPTTHDTIPTYDLVASSSIYNNPYDPETPDRSYQSSLMRRQGSTASNNSLNSLASGRLFAGEGVSNGGMFRPESFAGGSGFSFGCSPSGRPDSMFVDQYQILVRQAAELSRKLKEAEARFETSASSYEQEHSELESRLEEARAELLVKRREEKELRGAEKQHLAQISSLESDITKLTKSLERSRESYEGMKRNYTAQCEEAEKLRNLVAETRRENRAAEEAAHTHGQQVQQFERDRELLQGAINKLESDLAVARRAQDSLDDQKQENLVLKETIDRLRFDLDEMRSANRKSILEGNGNSSASGADGLVGGSMSKSLGRELARRLAASGPDEDDDELETEEEETEGEDEVDDIVVTTHRRIKKKRALKSTASEPTITHVQETTIVVDEETQTDPIPTREMDIQTDLSSVNVDLIAAPAVETQTETVLEEPAPPKTPEELQRELAQELGVDLSTFEKFVEAQNAGPTATPTMTRPVSSTSAVQLGAGARRAGRWASRMGSRAAVQGPALLVSVFPDSAKPYVAQILESSMTFFLYTATVYLTGFISGSWLFPITHHHHFAPFQVSFSQSDLAHNTMGSWGEGVVAGGLGGGIMREGLSGWIESMVWSGVSSVRRMPV